MHVQDVQYNVWLTPCEPWEQHFFWKTKVKKKLIQQRLKQTFRAWQVAGICDALHQTDAKVMMGNYLCVEVSLDGELTHSTLYFILRFDSHFIRSSPCCSGERFKTKQNFVFVISWRLQGSHTFSSHPIQG